MQASRWHCPAILCAVFTSWLLASAALLPPATGGFVATLSASQQTAAGLPALSASERAVLDQLVAAELAVVRQGDAGELAGTFGSRRSKAERLAAGLDRLTPAELARLNELVATALANRPKPKERPRLKEDDVVSAARKPEIHGSVSLMYGWGGGGSFHGSSLWLDYFDPTSGLGIGVGLSNFTGPGYFGGNGFDGYYPDYYGYGSRYYAPFLLYDDASFRGAARNDFAYGDGQTFRAKSSWDSGGGRHHR